MIVRYTQSAALVLAMLILAVSPSYADVATAGKTLEMATSGSGNAQYTAIDDLGERHEAAATVVPKLQQMLKNKDAQVRWRSARALGDYGALAAPAAADLRSLLADKDPIVQYQSAVALGRIGEKSDETVQALVNAVTSKDPRVARAAVAALRGLKPGPQRVMPALRNALKSDDDTVSLYAMEALVEAGAEGVPLLIEALKYPETAYMACAAIEQIGPAAAPAVPAIVELLGKTKHSQLQTQALLALAKIGPAAKSASSAIVPLLEQSQDPTVSAAAAYAVGAIGATDAEAGLRAGLAKDNPLFQMIAAWSLAKLHPEDKAAMQDAVEKLTAGLGNKDPEMRTVAAHGLQMLKAPPEMVAPALMKVAQDPDPDVEANVVIALAGLGEAILPKAIEALKKPEFHNLAAKVLTKLGPKASSAVEPLIAASKGADPEAIKNINLALSAIGPAAAPATEKLVQDLSSKDDRIKESAVYALMHIGAGAKAAVQPLVAKLSDPIPFDAMAAGWTLARIVPNDEKVAASAVPVLVKGLANPDDRVRLAAANALRAWGPAAKSAHDALAKAAKSDTNAAVRAAAESALSN